VTTSDVAEPAGATESRQPKGLSTGLVVLLVALLVVVVEAERWLRSSFMMLTAFLSLGALVSALEADQAGWAAVVLAITTVATTACLVSLLRPRSPRSLGAAWLILVVTSALDLGVMFVLSPP